MTSYSDSTSLVRKLVCHITGKPENSVKSEYRTALQILNCCLISYTTDEFSVCENIKQKFMLEETPENALKFLELYRKLQVSCILKNKANILKFLYCLYGFGNDKKSAGLYAWNYEKIGLDPEIILNARNIINNQISKPYSNVTHLNFIPSGGIKNSFTDLQLSRSKLNNKNDIHSTSSKISQIAAVFSTNCEDQNLEFHTKRGIAEKALTVTAEESNVGSVCLTSYNLKPLLRDTLLAVLGLRGDVIVWEPGKANFKVVFNSDVPNPIKRLILRFLNLGWMYCRINEFCKSQSNKKSVGRIAQSFVVALNEKLVDYHKLISEFESFLTQEVNLIHLYNNTNSLTFHKLSVWFFEPCLQLKILASVVDACKGKKGGALASILYSHLQHGDSYVRDLIQKLLQVVSRPLFNMLSKWIFCGELEDPFEEFFVACNIAVPDVHLWQEKYSLNKDMIPSFITTVQARKILCTGKAINFLQHVCHDKSFARDDERRMRAFNLMHIESLFAQERDGNFEKILERNYVKTNKIVLQVLNDKYHLMDHLLAMRNYFLLGQGDFIRHLMDLLNADLGKPVKYVDNLNLYGLLESAIRATNAQFHNPEVLQRLDVRLLDVSVIGDTGWDVFTLDYHTEGPIGTIFTSHSMNCYRRLFTALWRAKRMEFILNKISQSRSKYLNWQIKIPEISPVLYQCHVNLTHMVHFVQQMEYYMAFEVMECCWADLLMKMSSAQDLDQVIAAHENFLDTLLTRAFLDEESLPLRTQLKAIYDLIVEFDKVQATFWKNVRNIINKLKELEQLVETNTNKDTWGITERHKKEHNGLLAILQTKHIPTTKAELQILFRSFEEMVQKFLIMLNDHNDSNLRFLSFRMDFNEYFKNKNSRLHTSLTFQHRRKSFKFGTF